MGGLGGAAITKYYDRKEEGTLNKGAVVGFWFLNFDFDGSKTERQKFEENMTCFHYSMLVVKCDP